MTQSRMTYSTTLKFNRRFETYDEFQYRKQEEFRHFDQIRLQKNIQRHLYLCQIQVHLSQ